MDPYPRHFFHLGTGLLSLDTRVLVCGDYLPDQPDLGPGTAVAFNVVPRTKATYSPMPSFKTSAANPLNGRPLGAFSACDAAGNAGNYAGTTSKLYALTSASNPDFADKSATAYSTPAGNFWSFTEAEGKVYATNGFDPIQSVDTAGSSNFAPMGDDVPKARFVTFIQPGFLLLGDINDPTVGIQPQGVRWSSLGDPTDFPLVGSADAIARSSDWQNVAGPHGRMMGFAPDLATCNAALFFEQAVFRMVFTGTETIFAVQPVEKLRGTLSAHSIIQAGQIAYFLAPDGFFAFDGTQAIPIGAGKVNATFFKDADPNYIGQVRGAADPISGLCFWSYAGTGNNDGAPNRILVYHPIWRRFSLITDNTGGNLFVARTSGITLDGIDALGYTLDNLPFSLDAPELTGGRLTLGGFDTQNRYGAFTGDNMAYQVDTSEVQLLPGRCAKITGVRPLIDGDSNYSAAVGGRRVLQNPVVFAAATSANYEGVCPARNENRYQRVRLSAPAGNHSNHIQGAEVTFGPGARR
jgi:hypothetical protein